MKEQLLKKSLSAAKRKTISFLVILLLILLPFCSNALCVSYGVTFGNPQSSGGLCTGKGVCKASTLSDGSLGSVVTVTFVANTINPGVVIMRFSMSELMSKQPDQVSSFMDPNGYSFDSQYWLTGSMFASLNLMPNANVPALTPFAVQIIGDLVSVYIQYSHS